MRIEFLTKNCEASEHLKRITEEKLSKLDKYFGDGDTDCKVTLKKENNTYRTEIMLSYFGHFIRSEENGENFYDNIEKALSKIEGQIRKYRTKFDKQQKNSAFKEKTVFEEIPQEDFSAEKVVKEKNFKLKPMLLEEALEEMDMLGHSFFVYFDLKSQSIKILYKRKDGNLGLISPEV